MDEVEGVVVDEGKPAFTIKDVETYKHGLSAAEKRKWAFVASQAYKNSGGNKNVAVCLANRRVGKQKRKG